MFSKTVISIIFFAVLSVKLVWGNDIFHIPPSPPTIGSSVSFEAVISIDLPMNEAIFLGTFPGLSKEMIDYEAYIIEQFISKF